jgi:hypothetical protein
MPRQRKRQAPRRRKQTGRHAFVPVEWNGTPNMGGTGTKARRHGGFLLRSGGVIQHRNGWEFAIR